MPASNETICFAYTAGAYADVAPDPVADPLFDRYMQGRVGIFKALRDRGFSIVVSTEGKDSFHDADEPFVDAHKATEDALPGEAVRTPVSDLAIVVNRTSKILHIAGKPTIINSPEVYEYGNDKLRAYEDILAPHNMGIPTLPVSRPEDLEAALEQFGGGDVVLKKVMGSLSEGLHITDPKTARRLIEAGVGTDTAYAVQPRYDFTLPWPNTITPLSSAYNDSFAPLHQSGPPKELRMYGFLTTPSHGDIPDVTCFPVARSESGKDARFISPHGSRWTGLDPETAPPYLYDKTRAALHTLAQLTGSRAVYGCMDWAYGVPHKSQEDPRWLAVEGNFCGPGLVEPKRFGETGTIAVQHYVEFLGRAATPQG